MKEETMNMPPVSPPARCPVSCLALSRPGPVNHVTGGPPRPGSSGSGRKVDEAILKLAARLTQKTGVQDRLQSAVQESARPCVTFCQWMGVEMSNLDKHLWSLFMWEAFDL